MKALLLSEYLNFVGFSQRDLITAINQWDVRAAIPVSQRTQVCPNTGVAHTSTKSLRAVPIGYNDEMGRNSSTLRGSHERLREEGDGAYDPGLVLYFSCGQPAATAISLSQGAVELGRGTHGLAVDPRMSRRHARVSFDGRSFMVTDLESQNGTACDGKAIKPNQPTEVERVIRMGDSLFGISRNIQPLVERGVKLADGKVLGSALQILLSELKQAALLVDVLHVTGESGTGKELFAHAFHGCGPRREGPFISVNCAAIPQGLAERLLFGTRRGAYSGADAAAEGYIQAAAGGTLLLDEVGELELSIQAKLLRVIETKELVPLGAARPQIVELRVCSASNKDLKTLVSLGQFREDLYYRIGRPVVTIPPLRKRPEEIAWLVEAAVHRANPAATLHTSLIETCLLRPWPGNVRELLIEIRSAAQTSLIQGCARIESRHLQSGAGILLHAGAESGSIDLSGSIASSPPASPLDPAARARLKEALSKHQGNVSGAARELGLHRTQLRRMLEQHELDPKHFVIGEKAALDADEH